MMASLFIQFQSYHLDPPDREVIQPEELRVEQWSVITYIFPDVWGSPIATVR